MKMLVMTQSLTLRHIVITRRPLGRCRNPYGLISCEIYECKNGPISFLKQEFVYHFECDKDYLRHL